MDVNVKDAIAANLEGNLKAVRGKKRNTQPGHPGYLADPRLEREGEKIGAGYLIFRRGGSTKRVRCPEYPFEHPTWGATVAELERLQGKHPNEVFQIFRRCEARKTDGTHGENFDEHEHSDDRVGNPFPDDGSL